MIRKYIIVAEDSLKGFDEEIAKLEREWGAEEIEPCEDCISREATKEVLMAAWTNYMPIELDINLSFVLEKISELPSVTPSRPKGIWIEVDSLDGALWHKCSKCGETEYYATNYCPNCGADMRGEEEIESE